MLFEPNINVVVLEREPPAGIAEELEVTASRLQAGLLLLPLAPTLDGLQELLLTFRDAPHLARDIAFCVELFADLTESTLVGVRLARLTTAMCPRLHVDRVSLRCVVTYCGPGTEFVDSATFDRSLLDRVSAHDEVITQHTRAGEIVLLKGEAWPGNAGRGAVHRSPPAARDAARLVLTLDAL